MDRLQRRNNKRKSEITTFFKSLFPFYFLFFTSLDIQDVTSADIDDVVLLSPPELLLQCGEGVGRALGRFAVGKFNASTGLERVLQETALNIEHKASNAGLDIKGPVGERQDPAGSV